MGLSLQFNPHININCNSSQKDCVCLCHMWRWLSALCSAPQQWLRRAVYLSHGCQEALWVEKACHPEAVGTPFKDPSPELPVSIKQFCEPEAQGAGDPRPLQKHRQQCNLDKTIERRGGLRGPVSARRESKFTTLKYKTTVQTDFSGSLYKYSSFYGEWLNQLCWATLCK